MTTVVLYGREGCCLCDDAREVLERVLFPAPIRASRARHRLRRHPAPGLPGTDPRGGDRRAGSVRSVCGRVRARAPARYGAQPMSYMVGMTPTRRRRCRQAGRETCAGRSRAALALPPGPDPGSQDRQGDDLLPGTGGLHPRELHPDPEGSIGVWQVRQARGRLQRRVAESPDPEDPATSGQHNIALFGAGHLGTAIATSDIFADHGFRVVAAFDVDRSKLGERIGPLKVRHNSDLSAVIDEQDILVAVLAVPSRRPSSWPTSSSTRA